MRNEPCQTLSWCYLSILFGCSYVLKSFSCGVFRQRLCKGLIERFLPIHAKQALSEIAINFKLEGSNFTSLFSDWPKSNYFIIYLHVLHSHVMEIRLKFLLIYSCLTLELRYLYKYTAVRLKIRILF